MEFIVSWLIAAIIIFLLSFLLPGIAVSGFLSALVVALVLGLLNVFIKPVLVLLTLPINILTLGLFTFVINAFLVMLAAAIVPGFQVSSFWWALVFGIILSFTAFL